MTNEKYNEKLDEILEDYPTDSATDRDRTALLALEDGEVLEALGWSQAEVEEMHAEIKGRLQ